MSILFAPRGVDANADEFYREPRSHPKLFVVQLRLRRSESATPSDLFSEKKEYPVQESERISIDQRKKCLSLMAESSRTSRRSTYHVFLSFRGVDTRKGFTDHLYTALIGSGLNTFRDDNNIERGRPIDEELEKAIRQSRSSIIVFSKGYATSSSCLNELVMIMEQRSSGHEVLPVFYDVKPEHVSKQKGSYGEAFTRHEEECAKEESDEKKKKGIERIDGWRKALTQVADLAGLELKNRADQHEARFIQEIVKEIEAKVKRDVLRVQSGLIAIESRCQDINLWLQDDSKDVGVMVICGMGGIGKTTIAKHVYNSNFRSFEGSSFLADIRHESEQPKGITHLQKKLLFDISNGRKENIFQASDGITKIQNALCFKRVLLVLDDVDQPYQLDAILGSQDWFSPGSHIQDWFCPGSKIIITTRCIGLPKVYESCKIYEVEPLDPCESDSLFSIHACSQGPFSEDYMELSKSIVRKCQGLPLALKVLGSSLRGQNFDVWKSSLRKLDAIPNDEIQKKLKVSYDCLQDEHDKDLFLDIACFFVGTSKNEMVTILDECDFSTIAGFQNLMDRCLVSVDLHDKLVMHDLVKDMGREIVRLESPKQPGKRSRLWNSEDSFNVLDDKSGTKNVEGLFLDMHRLNEYKPGLRGRGNNLKADAFEKMKTLRLLKVNYLQLAGSYSEFPKRLKWLCWHGFSLPSIPDNFALERLVSLDMRYSSLKQVWNGGRFLGCLKILNLSHSKSLEKTPDFSSMPILERLILKHCTCLKVVDKSILYLKKLSLLNLKGCQKLRTLPKGINMLEYLKKLVISHCSSLCSCPVDMSRMTSLKVLKADGLDMNMLFRHNFERKSWHALIRPRVQKHNPEILWAALPRSLVAISLVGCNLSDDAFPSDITHLSSLRNLDLSSNPICGLPDCIRGLKGLQTLCLMSCTRLQSVEEVPELTSLQLEGCESIRKITFQSSQGALCDIHFSYNSQIEEILFHFKIEPIEKVDVRMTTILGLSNLESLANMQVTLCGGSFVTKKRPIQGLYEQGVFSTFFHRRDVEGWFSHGSGSSVTLSVTSYPNNRIQGLNVILIYGFNSVPVEHKWKFPHMRVKIRNNTKGTSCTYMLGSLLGFPEGDQDDIVWLSHWEIGNSLESGDEVTVTIDGGYYFLVKECGVRIVYEHDDDHDQYWNGDAVIPNEVVSTAHGNFLNSDNTLTLATSGDVCPEVYYRKRPVREEEKSVGEQLSGKSNLQLSLEGNKDLCNSSLYRGFFYRICW